MKQIVLTLLLILVGGPALADPDFSSLAQGADGRWFADAELTQSGCMSLSRAVDSVRRRGNVERIVSAETKVQGGKEVHHIRYMTKDGKVRTAKVAGCRR